jgi:hypothetical protein
MQAKNIPEDFVFVSTDFEVEELKNQLGKEAKEYDAFFIKVKNGEIVEAYGMHGIVPHNDKLVWKII